MIVHLYAQCWNDEWMLPFFFRHYDEIVDRYFIYDDGSDDATPALLHDHHRVEARRFQRSVPGSFALSEQAFSNDCWKESRGKADWVIVTDLDEHLHHRDGRGYLESCAGAGVTLIPALGFQMISEREPDRGERLATAYRMGMPWHMMMKASIFNPNEIAEVDFELGRHGANPSGRVELPETDEMVLLHYKYLDFGRTLRHQRMLLGGLGEKDVEMRWGENYTWSDEEFRADWDQVAANAVDYLQAMEDPDWRYPIEPWWEKYRSRHDAAAS
jgi:hypothetical protein